MKEAFRDWRPKADTAIYLEKVIEVIDSYAERGFRLTLRQLYYQLVTKGIIPNQKREYAKLSDVLTRARMAGLVDWDAIEDRIRGPRKHAEWDNIKDLVESACNSYRLSRWSDQRYYIELWTEKDAIAGILKPMTDKYHITLCVNRGYSSATAMYDAAKRMIAAEREGKEVVLLYLGDHDPSGLDMDRDIQDRLAEFGATFEYTRIGLTWDQVQKYEPPPNPAKFSDPRAVGYIERYGEYSWEVDALPPEVLQQLVESAISKRLVVKSYNKWISKEEKDRKKLRKLTKDILKEK